MTSIRVHLTPYAPGCSGRPIDDPARWRTFRDRSPEQVIRTVLTRLGRPPAQVRVRTEDPPLTDVDLMAEVDGLLCPVASLCSGVTAAQACAILADLNARGWRPTPKS